eukprot:PhM_4_TR3087/c3_g1_i1/m.53879
MSLTTTSSYYYCVSLVLLLLILSSVSSPAHAASHSTAVFKGSFVTAATESSLRRGGDVLTVSLVGDAWADGLAGSDVARAIRDAFVSGCHKVNTGWNALRDTMICDGCVKLTSTQTAVVILAPEARYNIVHPERLVLAIPGSVLKSGFTRRGPDIYIMPEERLSVAVAGETEAVAGVEITLQLTGKHLSSVDDGVKIVDGEHCRAPQAHLQGKPKWDPKAATLKVTFLTGGTFSVCYRPNLPDDEHDHVVGGADGGSTGNRAAPVVLAQGMIAVTGPEGYNTDPAVVTTNTEFDISFFGTKLTEFDHVVLTPEPTCPHSKVEEGLFGSDHVLAVHPSGRGKAVAYARLPRAQSYRVCYFTKDSTSYVPLRDIRVQHGGGVLVTDSQPVLTIEEDTRITDTLTVDYLYIQAGTLQTDHYEMNVTHLEWFGGAVTGRGTLAVIGSNSRICLPSNARRSLESKIKNFGNMDVHLNSTFDMGDSGALLNYGTMHIVVNDTVPLSDVEEHTLSGTLHSLIHNKGFISIKRLSTILKRRPRARQSGSTTAESEGTTVAPPPMKLRISTLLVNDGRIVIEDSIRVTFESLRGISPVSSISLHPGASATVTGMLSGTIALSNATLILKDNIVMNEPITIIGHENSDSHVLVQATTADLHSVNVRGVVNVVVDSPRGNVTLHGVCSFAHNVTLIMRRGTIRSHMIARMNVDGDLIIYLPDVTVGPGVVISATTRAIFIGDGDVLADEETSLTTMTHSSHRNPSSSSSSGTTATTTNNATLIIPKEAKLLLLNLPSPTTISLQRKNAVPNVCPDYLIIPMSVELRGYVYLYGCAMLPFGGTHSATVRSLHLFDDDGGFGDLLSTAVCQKILSGKNPCPQIASLGDEPSHHHDAGYTLGGHHTFVDDSEFLMNHFSVVKNGIVDFREEIIVRLSGNLTIDSNGIVSFHRGGIVHSGTTHVFGQLNTDASHTVALHGDLSVYTGGNVGIHLTHHTPSCSAPPFVVNGSATFDPESVLTCNDTSEHYDVVPTQFDALAPRFPSTQITVTSPQAHLAGNDTTAMYPIMKYNRVIGRPKVDPSCGDLNVVTYGSFAELRTEHMHHPEPIIMMYGVLVTAFAVVALVAVMMCQATSLATLRREIFVQPPFDLDLTWDEFVTYPQNYLSAVYLLIEMVCLVAPAMHPLVPVPQWLHNLHWYDGVMTAGRALYVPVAVLVLLWAALWVPLFSTNSRQRMKVHAATPAMVLYVRVHVILCNVLTYSFFPIVMILLVPFHGYLDVDAATSMTCASFACTSSALIVVYLFIILVPYSGGNKQFPFAHPPYQRELDLRLKRSYVFMQHTLFVLQLSATHLYYADPVRLLFCCVAVQVTLFLLHYFSAPCAYHNCNQFRGTMYVLSLFVTVMSLVQVLRHGSGPISPCRADVEYPVFAGVGIGIILLFSRFLHFTNAARSGCSLHNRLRADDNAIEANAMWQTTIARLREAIESEKAQLFDSPPSVQRSLWARLAARKGELFTTLNAYRAFKEQYFIVYYLAKSVEEFTDDTGLGSCGGIGYDLEMANFLPNAYELGYGDGINNNNNNKHKKTLSGSQNSNSNGSDSSHPASQGSSGKEELSFSQDELDQWVRGPVIGRGNFGTVYMGMIAQQGVARLVAVKEISTMPGHLREGELSSLRAEVALLQKLVHPNIIRHYGVSETECSMSVVMEFAVGGSLTSLSKKFRRLSPSIIRLYTYEMLQGLRYLHRHNVVHRDIKGDNVLIDAEGHVRLADFGASRLLSGMSKNPTGGVGSPYFMAPEVIKNLPYDTKADIWSVGCTVVEMLNGGQAPWVETFENAYAAMYYIGCTEGIPTNVPEDISPMCRDFLAKCFFRNPLDRWDADQLLEHPWVSEYDAYEPTTRTFLEMEKREICGSAGSSMTWCTDTNYTFHDGDGDGDSGTMMVLSSNDGGETRE